MSEQAWLCIEAAHAFCYLPTFTINGIEADEGDFGDHYDHDSDAAEPYGCGDMRFEASDSTPEVLAKYGISEAQYEQVCDALSEALSWGSCGWCV